MRGTTVLCCVCILSQNKCPVCSVRSGTSIQQVVCQARYGQCHLCVLTVLYTTWNGGTSGSRRALFSTQKYHVSPFLWLHHQFTTNQRAPCQNHCRPITGNHRGTPAPQTSPPSDTQGLPRPDLPRPELDTPLQLSDPRKHPIVLVMNSVAII